MEDRGWKFEIENSTLRIEIRNALFGPSGSESSIFNYQVSIPPASILDPQSSILNPRSSILDPQSSILNPQSLAFSARRSYGHGAIHR